VKPYGAEGAIASARRATLHSESQLAVRPYAHKLQHVAARLAVDHHQIRLHVTVPELLPVPAQRMIDVPGGQCRIGREQRQYGREQILKISMFRGRNDPLLIPLESLGALNPSH